MSAHASTATVDPSPMRELASELQRLGEIVHSMYRDFPILERDRFNKEPIVYPFNLPSRTLMESVDEDLFEISDELETQTWEGEDQEWRDVLVEQLQAVVYAFEEIHSKVFKLDPVRVNETLSELEEAEGGWSQHN